MLTALLLSVLAPAGPVRAFEYDRYALFELALCAERVVTGEIERVGSRFALRVEQRIVGDDLPDVIEVERFENWTCASRWAPYRTGQRVLLFLESEKGSRTYHILGGGGEGEMPLAGSDVIVRGYDVHGCERGTYEVQDGRAEGSRVGAREVFDAVRGFRAAFRWDVVSERGLRPRSIEPREPELARAFEQSSLLARHFVEQARSSPEWSGPPADAGLSIAPERLRRVSGRALGLAATDRIRATAAPYEPCNHFGSLAFVGDVDGDGIGDLAAAVEWDSRAALRGGALWILFLASDGSVRAKTEIGQGTGGFPADLNAGAYFGCALAPLGDLNADGVPDLAVGARGWRHDGQLQGGVWVLFLARDGSVSASVELGAAETLARAGAGVGAGIGASLAVLGDLDGDGSLELALGQDPDFDLGEKHGRAVWIVSLARDGGVQRARRIHAREDGFLEEYSWFGAALARVGDLDGDGTTELAIADTYDRDGGEVRGAVWIAFLARDGSLKRKQKISDWAGGFDGEMHDWEQFGKALAGPGDLDGDGVADLLVGSSSGLWTLMLTRDGTVKGAIRLCDPARREHHFAHAIACAGHGASGPAVAVSGTIGAEERDEEASNRDTRDSKSEAAEGDLLVWFFSIEGSGRIAPW